MADMFSAEVGSAKARRIKTISMIGNCNQQLRLSVAACANANVLARILAIAVDDCVRQGFQQREMYIIKVLRDARMRLDDAHYPVCRLCQLAAVTLNRHFEAQHHVWEAMYLLIHSRASSH
jgi:hypothetical protein